MTGGNVRATSAPALAHLKIPGWPRRSALHPQWPSPIGPGSCDASRTGRHVPLLIRIGLHIRALAGPNRSEPAALFGVAPTCRRVGWSLDPSQGHRGKQVLENGRMKSCHSLPSRLPPLPKFLFILVRIPAHLSLHLHPLYTAPYPPRTYHTEPTGSRSGWSVDSPDRPHIHGPYRPGALAGRAKQTRQICTTCQPSQSAARRRDRAPGRNHIPAVPRVRQSRQRPASPTPKARARNSQPLATHRCRSPGRGHTRSAKSLEPI